jgi:hypothetical protein
MNTVALPPAANRGGTGTPAVFTLAVPRPSAGVSGVAALDVPRNVVVSAMAKTAAVDRRAQVLIESPPDQGEAENVTENPAAH